MPNDFQIPLYNPKKRELSSFMAQQLLYDYATKKIDPLREKAVAKSVESSPELAMDLDDIIYGLSYCNHLSKASISAELLKELSSPVTWRVRLKRYRNLRNWNQSTAWILEAVGISLFILVLSFAVPWPTLFTFFLKNQGTQFFISETARDSSLKSSSKEAPSHRPIPGQEYLNEVSLGSVNPDFTVKKLMVSLPRLGASIEHHSLRNNSKGEVVPFLRISTPKNQTEALILELKSKGQLTWIRSPAENDKEGPIFGITLWINPMEPPKAKTLIKDESGE